MITADGICAGYGSRTVLRDINIEFLRGEMTAILGPNGSGKTTLVSTLSGIIKPEKGSVCINGNSVLGLSRKVIAKLLAVIPQRFDLPFDITVRNMVLMGRYSYSRRLLGYRHEDYRICNCAMEKTSVYHLRNRSIRGLSGGELQRTLIARAIAQNTPMMVLDEAASGIDVSGKMEIFNLLRTLKKSGTGIISVIHDLNLASLYFDRLIFIKDGQVVLDGLPSEVITEENIKNVYDAAVSVVKHPWLGLPQIMFNPDADDFKSTSCQS